MSRPTLHFAVILSFGALPTAITCGPADAPPGRNGSSQQPRESTPDTAAPPESLSGPADTAPGTSAVRNTVAVHRWTASELRSDASAGPVGTLRALRTEGLEDFDRITLEMDRSGVPDFVVGYVDAPIRECGSGRAVELPGRAWLRVRMSGARGHTDRGEATVRPRIPTPDLARVLRIDRTCDFEGVLVLVLSLDERRPFRLTEAEAPGRLVLDVAADPLP